MNAHFSITISTDKAPKKYTYRGKWILVPVQTNQPDWCSKVLAWRSFPSGVVPVIPSFPLPPHSGQATSLKRIHSHVSRQQQQTCRRRGAAERYVLGRTRTRTTRAQKRSQARSLTLRQKGRRGEQVWGRRILAPLAVSDSTCWFGSIEIGKINSITNHKLDKRSTFREMMI